MAAINLTSSLRLDAEGNPESVFWVPNRDFIADQSFNLGRKVKPKQSLHGVINDEAVLDKVIEPLMLRIATAEEKTKWKEIHATDAWFAALGDQQDTYIPSYIIADGFGRADAHLVKHDRDDNEVPPMECKIAETSDTDESLILGVYMNSTSRPAHFLDQYAAFQACKRKKAKQKEIAGMYGVSEAQVSTILNVCKELTQKQIEKIVKDDTPFYKVEAMVKGTTTPTNGSANANKMRAISAKVRNNYVNNCSKAAEGVAPESEEASTLAAMEFAFRFSGGEFGDKSLLDAAHSCSVLESVSFDFEHDEAAEQEKAVREAKKVAKAAEKLAAKEAKEAEREVAKATKAADKEAKAATKLAEKEAKEAEKLAAKEAKEAEKLAAKEAKEAAKKKPTASKKVSKKAVASKKVSKKPAATKKKATKKKA